MADVSPDSLRRFLLGRLPDPQMDALGERLVADEAFGDEMAEAEDTLIDSYLAGTLPHGECDAFERHYLATAVHRARVETRRALAGRAASTPRLPASDAARALPAMFGATRWMALAASIVLAVGLYVTRPGRSADGTSPATSPASPSSPGGPSTPAAPTAAAAAMPTATLTLSAAAATRGQGAMPVLAVPAGTALVQFRLVGDLPPADELTAEIMALDGDEVKRWPVDAAARTDDGASRTVTVPPYAVPPGDYVLTLWAGDADLVQRYAFRVAP